MSPFPISVNLNLLTFQELETQQELYKSKEVKKLVAEVRGELLKMDRPSVVKVDNWRSVWVVLNGRT